MLDRMPDGLLKQNIYMPERMPDIMSEYVSDRISVVITQRFFFVLNYLISTLGTWTRGRNHGVTMSSLVLRLVPFSSLTSQMCIYNIHIHCMYLPAENIIAVFLRVAKP